MTLGINTNVPSISAQRSLKNTLRNHSSNLRKLSTGERITRASDDAAGLAISENLKAQIRSSAQAERNAGDAISMVQVAEGGLSEISNMLIRLRELSMQAATDTVGDLERGFSDKEFQALKSEIDRITRSSEFNSLKLLDGTGGIFEFQIGVHNDPILDRLRFDTTQTVTTLEGLGLTTETVGTKVAAQNSLKVLDNALVKVNGIRADLGALQNRLNSVTQNLQVSIENNSAANSRIRDVDVAHETADMAKNNILMQAGTSVLAQANQYPQIALKLLG